MSRLDSTNAPTRRDLEALGGTWDIEHTHTWPGRAEGVTECAEGCAFEFGTHVRRWRWRGEPLPAGDVG